MTKQYLSRSDVSFNVIVGGPAKHYVLKLKIKARSRDLAITKANKIARKTPLKKWKIEEMGGRAVSSISRDYLADRLGGQSKCKHPLKNRQMGIVDGKLVLRCSKCKLRVPLPKSSYKKVTVNLEDL